MAVSFPTALDAFQRKTNKPGTVVAADTTQVYATGSAQIGDYNDLELAIERLEAKVGIDSSAVTTSLDYLLRSPTSLSPGHRHDHIFDSAGLNSAMQTDAAGDIFFNPGSVAAVWGGVAHNPGTFFYGSDGLNLYGVLLGHDNAEYGLTMLSTSNNPDLLVGYHNANNAPQMNQIGYGLRLNAKTSSLYFALGSPGTPPAGAGTPPDWAHEPRFYLQAIQGADAWSGRMNLRATHLRIGPQDSIVHYDGSGLFSALLVLERSGDANDASILFKSGTPNQSYWSFELPGTNDLSIKKITGTHSPYAESFTNVTWWQYTTGRMAVGSEGFNPAGQLHIYPAAVGQPSLVVDSKPSPTTDIQQWALNGAVQAAIRANYTLSASLDGVINVKAPRYGAKGDGTTDDTTAIQNALADAAAALGVLYFPPGTYLTSQTLTLSSGLYVRGAGVNATTIKLKNASNQHVFATTNFATLTGTNTDAGPHSFGVADLTIDGNQANQTVAKHGIAIYGMAYFLTNVVAKNCRDTGIYSEWAASSGTVIGPDQMESHWLHVKAHDNLGNGITFAGPHDTIGEDVISFNNGVTAVKPQIHFSGSGLSQWSHIHCYEGAAGTPAILVDSGQVSFTDCEAEGNATGPQVTINQNTTRWIGGQVFVGGTGLDGACGFKVAAGFCRIENVFGEDFPGGLFDLSSSGGDNYLVGSVYIPETQPPLTNPPKGITGSPNINDYVKVRVTGIASPATVYQFSFESHAPEIEMDAALWPQQTISANGQTVTWHNANGAFKLARPTNAGAFTGLILQPGLGDGQLLDLVNEGTGALTFAAAATSNVAGGTGCSIAVGFMKRFRWDAGTARWYST